MIKNKISEKYTLFGSIFGSINSIFWFIWAITNDNNKTHSIVANIFGILLCLSQFLIFYIFKKDEEEENDDYYNNNGNTKEESEFDKNTNKAIMIEKSKSEEKEQEDTYNEFI